jgi:hypothetical protein
MAPDDFKNLGLVFDGDVQRKEKGGVEAPAGKSTTKG